MRLNAIAGPGPYKAVKVGHFWIVEDSRGFNCAVLGPHGQVTGTQEQCEQAAALFNQLTTLDQAPL